ncbi:MAG: hypothetical protein Q4Q53_07905 [Methanocorpusculum sp.]|nr:hypothetical protein [Methanocorpusculum sp.]
MTHKNFTNLTNFKKDYPKNFYCPVCGLTFAGAYSKPCSSCGYSTPLYMNSKKIKEAVSTHKKTTNLIYSMIEKQNKAEGAE